MSLAIVLSSDLSAVSAQRYKAYNSLNSKYQTAQVICPQACEKPGGSVGPGWANNASLKALAVQYFR